MTKTIRTSDVTCDNIGAAASIYSNKIIMCFERVPKFEAYSCTEHIFHVEFCNPGPKVQKAIPQKNLKPKTCKI